MENHKADTRLKVVFLSLPQRNQAVLEYFFASTGHGSFALSAESSAEAAIFDFDNLESREHWESFHARTGKPGIALSVSPQDLPMTVWVQKPVAPASLLQAAEKIHNGAWSSGPVAVAAVPTPSAPPERPNVAPAPAPEAPQEAVEVARVEPEPPTVVEEVAPAEVEVPPSPATPLVPPVALRTHEPDQSPSSPENLVETVPPPVKAGKAPSPPRATVPREAEPPQSLWSWLLQALFGRKKAAPKRMEAVRPVTPPAVAEIEVTAPVVPEARPAFPAPLEPEAAVIEPAQAPEVMASAVPADPGSSPVAEAPLVVAKVAEPVPELAPPAPKARPEASLREMADAPRFCGEREDLPEPDFATTPDLFYSYGDYLISALREAYLVGAKWRAPTRLDLEFGAVTYVPAENRGYIDFTEEVLKAELRAPQHRRYKVRMVAIKEFADMQEHLALAHKLDRFDAILWRLALETSQGRLPQGTDLNKVFYLKSWPNMTRFQPTPHAMRIAALWATRGASLLETAQTLNIPQRYVFAFYNAAYSADLVTDSGAHIQRASRKSHKNRGGFARIFDWLRN